MATLVRSWQGRNRPAPVKTGHVVDVEFAPQHTVADKMCFACSARVRLRTGHIAGVALLWCPQHEAEYRHLKMEFTNGSDRV